MYLFIDTSKTYMYIRWQCFNCYPSWFVVEMAIGVSTCDPSETNTQINHIHRTTSFFERSKDVKTMIDLKSRFTNVDLLSSRFVIIAICGCEFLRLLIVNHILTFFGTACCLFILNCEFSFDMYLKFVSRFTRVHFRNY